MANQGGRSVAAVDLNRFVLARQIPLEGAPNAVIAHPTRAAVYVLTPDNATIYEIEVASLAIKRRTRPAQSAISMRLAGDGLSLWLLCREPRALVRVPLDTLRAAERIPLAHEPGDFIWVSRRATKGITLSARLADNAALEDYMMREFFGGDQRQP